MWDRGVCPCDSLVLVDGEKVSIEEEEMITTPLYRIELETGVAISPIVMTKHEWESRPIKTPFYLNVMREGVLLWKRNWTILFEKRQSGDYEDFIVCDKEDADTLTEKAIEFVKTIERIIFVKNIHQ